MCHAEQPVPSSLPEISMFWPSTTEPSGPGGWHFGALTKSKKITSPEHTSRDCLLIRFSEIIFKSSLDRAYPLVPQVLPVDTAHQTHSRERRVSTPRRTVAANVHFVHRHQQRGIVRDVGHDRRRRARVPRKGRSGRAQRSSRRIVEIFFAPTE